MNNSKWWLISKEDAEEIRDYLLTMAMAGDEVAQQALHALESGLHATDAAPDDFAVEPTAPETFGQ